MGECKSPYCKDGKILLYDHGYRYLVRCPECAVRELPLFNEDNQDQRVENGQAAEVLQVASCGT